MIRAVVALALILGSSAASLSADLRYTMRTVSRPASAPAARPPDPLFGMLGTIVVGMLAPGGSLEVRAIVSDRGARFEYDKAFAVVPEGGVMLVAPDGSITVLNPAERTYWRTPRPQGALGTSAVPVIKLDRTGTFDTIAGVRAERATVEVRLPLAVSSGAAMPGVPAEISMTGETWLADEYKRYATTSSSVGSLFGSAGAETLATAGFPVRSIVRSDLFAGQEIESVVTSISEEPAPPDAFDIPAGFTEVAPPSLRFPPIGLTR